MIFSNQHKWLLFASILSSATFTAAWSQLGQNSDAATRTGPDMHHRPRHRKSMRTSEPVTTLTIESDPSGASVEIGSHCANFVDEPGSGRKVGLTPVTVELRQSDVAVCSYEKTTIHQIAVHLSKLVISTLQHSFLGVLMNKVCSIHRRSAPRYI